MPLLLATAVLAVALSLLNLAFIVGILKKLREHAELLSRTATPRVSLGVGEPVGDFTATTVDGERVGRDALADDTVVGFFSTSCEPCKAVLPRFVDFADGRPGGPARVLAVVVGDAADSAAFVAELSLVATVVVEDVGGAVGTAFGVRAFPVQLVVGSGRDGRAVVTADRVDLDRPVAAPA